MKALQITQFGNPILRTPAKHLSKAEISSLKVQNLIKDMQHTLTSVKLGVGLAAPQVGEGIALAVIVIQPTSQRPDVEPLEMVLINPAITTQGRKRQLWEGCISSGNGKAGLFAKVPRYRKIVVNYTDEKGVSHQKNFEGLTAHVIQHETDHINGVLFVDKVRDTTTYMTYAEYLKHVKKKTSANESI